MWKKLIVSVVALSLIASVGADTIVWDFEDGDGHRFDLWSAFAATWAPNDPNIAGDEAVTGVGGFSGLPAAGVAWSVGAPTAYEGLKPAVDEGSNQENGLIKYGANTPFNDDDANKGMLNTYALSCWGDGLHAATNDQIASSPVILLDADAVLTVTSYGGGSGTMAPAYAENPDDLYETGSSGIAVLDANDYALLASVHCNGKGDPEVAELDLSAFAGMEVIVEVVDAFEGGWGWLCVDEITVTNASSRPPAAMVIQLTDDVASWGFDQAQMDRLTDMGYDVIVVPFGDIQDEIFLTEDANDMAVVVVSESPGSSSTVKIAKTSAPILHEEAFGWRRQWALTAASPGPSWQGGTEVEVVNDTHPINVEAGLGLGMMTFYARDLVTSWTTQPIEAIAPGAVLLGQITVAGADYPDWAIVFAIEEGELLADGLPALNRMVGFSITGVAETFEAEVMSDEAWAWFDACINWLDPKE